MLHDLTMAVSYLYHMRILKNIEVPDQIIAAAFMDKNKGVYVRSYFKKNGLICAVG